MKIYSFILAQTEFQLREVVHQLRKFFNKVAGMWFFFLQVQSNVLEIPLLIVVFLLRVVGLDSHISISRTCPRTQDQGCPQAWPPVSPSTTTWTSNCQDTECPHSTPLRSTQVRGCFSPLRSTIVRGQILLVRTNCNENGIKIAWNNLLVFLHVIFIWLFSCRWNDGDE